MSASGFLKVLRAFAGVTSLKSEFAREEVREARRKLLTLKELAAGHLANAKLLSKDIGKALVQEKCTEDEFFSDLKNDHIAKRLRTLFLKAEFSVLLSSVFLRQINELENKYKDYLRPYIRVETRLPLEFKRDLKQTVWKIQPNIERLVGTVVTAVDRAIESGSDFELERVFRRFRFSDDDRSRLGLLRKTPLQARTRAVVSEPRAVATGSMRNFDHNTHCVSGRSCPSFRRRGCTSEFDQSSQGIIHGFVVREYLGYLRIEDNDVGRFAQSGGVLATLDVFEIRPFV